MKDVRPRVIVATVVLQLVKQRERLLHLDEKVLDLRLVGATLLAIGEQAARRARDLVAFDGLGRQIDADHILEDRAEITTLLGSQRE